MLSSLRWRRAHPDPALPLLPPSIQGSTRLSHPRPGDTVNAGALLPLSFRGAPSGRGPQPSSPEGGRTKSPVPPAASSHRTPRAPALCPAAVGAALPASSAASRARARTHPRRAARRGCGSLRRSNRCGRREDACDSHACPAARPSASWRAGERAAPAAGGSAPRASRGPPAPPPASGKPRASRPYPTPRPQPARPPQPPPLASGGSWGLPARGSAAVRSAQVGPRGASALAGLGLSAPACSALAEDPPGRGARRLHPSGPAHSRGSTAASRASLGPSPPARSCLLAKTECSPGSPPTPPVNAGYTWGMGKLGKLELGELCALEFLGDDRSPSRFTQFLRCLRGTQRCVRGAGPPVLCIPFRTHGVRGARSTAGLGRLGVPGGLLNPPP